MDTPWSRLLHQEPLTHLGCLRIHAKKAKVDNYGCKQCLRIEDGLVILNNPNLLSLGSGKIEVDIAAEGSACPGIAFRIVDNYNYELMYTRAASSGQFDALQYDPVFRGSNTWQIYHGPEFQNESVIPSGRWYTLTVKFSGRTASIHLAGQEPLTVESLAMPQSSGAIGIWTCRPAYFRNLRVYAADPEAESTAGPKTEPRTELRTEPKMEPRLGTIRTPRGSLSCKMKPRAKPRTESETTDQARSRPLPPGTVTAWLAEGHGVVHCEPHGILNLNRYFPLSLKEVTLTRRFTLQAQSKIVMSFGLSDDLTLSIDGLPLYTSTKPFRPTAGAEGKGYVGFDTCKMTRVIGPGVHTLSVKLKVTEPFGWGLALSLTGGGLDLMPL